MPHELALDTDEEKLAKRLPIRPIGALIEELPRSKKGDLCRQQKNFGHALGIFPDRCGP